MVASYRFPVTRGSLSLFLVVVLLGGLRAESAVAQTSAAIQDAHRLEDAGEFSQAAQALAGYLEQHPGDGPTWWFRAQLLVRAGAPDQALESYQQSLPLLPQDPWLRLEYARLLVDQGRWREAPAVVEPILEIPEVPEEAAAQAHDLLASLYSWKGDRSRALEHSKLAVALAPDRVDFRRHLDELLEDIRPWAGANLDVLDDDQPFRRSRVRAEGGVFLTPNLALGAEAAVIALEGGEAGTGLSGAVALEGPVGGTGVDISVSGGGVGHSDAGSSESSWRGEAELGIRLPGGARVRLGAFRDRYLWTASSADTLVMENRVEFGIARAAAEGWSWEAVLRGENYGDDNTVRTAYGWILAPVVPGIRVGYALVLQDSEESRWAAPGAYIPYFTPEELVSNGVLLELAGTLDPVDARLSINYGFWAREQAPFLSSDTTVGGSGVAVEFYERSFHPLTATAGLFAPVGDGLILELEAEYQRNTYYEMFRVGLTARYRWRVGRE